MHFQRSLAAAALLGAQLALLGCTAGVKMVPVKPLDADLRPYTSVELSVVSNVAEDVEKERSDLEGLALSKIKALNMFQSVQLGDGTGAQAGTLIVKASINKMKKVGGTKRFFLGAFAGRASMTTDIMFVEGGSQRDLGSYSITGQSGGTGLSGGTSDAVKKAAEGIADLLAKNYKGR